MFASNNNSCCGDVDSISYNSDPAFFSRPFLNDIMTINIPNSKQEELLPSSSLPFFHFPPSPFDPNHDQVVDLFDHHHHHQHHHESLLLHSQDAAADKSTVSDQTNTAAAAATTTKMVSCSDLMTMMMNHHNHINIEDNNATSSEFVVKQIPRKRSCKRDRHSKINTARGPRDRRMRLSLEVARKFFGLQDMLGFDKASKTVEWLLIQAKSEIKKLARELNIHRSSCSTNKRSTSSTTSECEVVSGTDEVTINGDHQQSCGRRKSFSAKEKKQRLQSRKHAFHPLARRESRDKARARARERTREKSQKPVVVDESKQENQLRRLSSWSPFETGEESGTQSQNLKHNSLEALVPEVEEPISSHMVNDHVGTAHEDMVEDDRPFVIMSPSSFFNSQYNTGISQEHQFADFQFLWQTMGRLQQP